MTNYVLLLRMSLSGKIGETGDGGIGRAQPDGVIRFEADNVSSLDDVYSPEVEVKGVPWTLNVFKCEGYLHLFLYCIPKQSTQWEIDADVDFILIHPDINKNIAEKKTGIFTNEDEYFGWALLTWDELIDARQGFIKDDKITVEVRFWINNMRGIKNIPRINFSDPDDPRHDITLVIEGEKIYASKQILAVHSPVFHTMFYGDFNEKGKQEIEVKDVDREEFLEMLRVIYTCRKKITDESAVYLLELGDRFQIACVIECVEEFLISSEDISNMEKLLIADQFRLFGLLKHCLSDLKTTQDFKDVQESYIFGSLSADTLRSLFMRHLKIAKMSQSGKTGATDAGDIGRAQPDGVIRFVAGSVSSWKNVYSPEVEMKGVSWKLHVWKISTLNLSLYCIPKQSTQWEIKVNAEFILLHPDSSKNITKENTGILHNESTCIASSGLLIWNNVINDEKGFVKDDKFTVEVRFWISRMRGIKDLPRVNFTEPNDPRHDITLVIDGEKVYVNKGILAVHSPFFNTMFYGDFAEKGKEEIELKDVDREEFLDMLRVIYTCSKKITVASAKYLLKLGDRFQITCVVECVEMFLISSTTAFTMEKLRISDQYRLFGLQKHCLSMLKTTQEFNPIKESPIYNDLSVEMMQSIFERLLEIAK